MTMASAFSKDFPYLRVDLYSVNKIENLVSVPQVLFGEFTFFPGSGSEAVDPFSFDLAMGKKLRL